MHEAHDIALRIDKWLWAARFFKTRSMAASAVNGGKVHLNGERVKPSRKIHVGDRLKIVKGEDNYMIEVMQLDHRRGPAAQAQGLYREDEANRLEREKQAQIRRFERSGSTPPLHRPDKRSRRRIRALRGLK
ncbi:RNA-binding S4 domain-containing protein [Acidihalobacter prosperus]